ncbi:unnamed protein product [Staurois parvus]|nr:unnamed protein product [Staurois parvus]
MICVAPAVPPVSVHQCQLCGHPYHLPVPINATYQCPSELPFSATYQYYLSVPVSATYQCASVPPNSASQCRLLVCISAT